MGSLFISYAREDDEPFVKRLYEDLTANGQQVWWDRECMPNRALKFTQEIRDAVENSDRLLLIIGPRAAASDYVRYEWQHALLFAKGVVPILRKGPQTLIPGELCQNDYKLVPPELSKFHCPDFRESRPYEESLEELLRILAQPVPDLGQLLTWVPGLPPHFLPRRTDFDRLNDRVLADIERPTIITSVRQTTVVHGMGGVGKSVLAAALARATNTRRAFTDGILWLSIGQHPDVLQILRQVAVAFNQELGHYSELSLAKVRLPRLFERKVCLLVLDDVWNVEYAKVFSDALGPRCRLLITTRDLSMVTALEAQDLPLDVLPEDQSLALLADWAGMPVEELPSAATEVIRECGYLPLALSLCGTHARDGISWTDLLDALRGAELEYLDHPHGSVMRSLKVSVDALPRDEQERYFELAVFGKQEAVPESIVATLWQQTGRLKGRHARQLLIKLKGRALLTLEGHSPDRRVSLHDLLHAYLIQQTPNLSALHQRLLDAYAAQCPNSWPTGPNDGYYFERLTWHLIQAARAEELRDLLLDYCWIEAKLKATEVYTLIQDYGYLPDDAHVSVVGSALRLSAHILAGDKHQLASQLIGRLLLARSEAVQRMLAQIRETKREPWFEPLRASLTQSGGPMIRRLKGHSGAVKGVAVTLDGQHIISASSDQTLKVWDLETGVELHVFSDHSDEVNCVAVTPDGKRVLSGSRDGILKLWDLKTGDSLRTLKGHTHSVNAVTMARDGRHALSASDDGTLKLWDLETGIVLRTLGDPGAAVFVTEFAFEDGVLRLAGPSTAVHAVAFAFDEQCAVSGSDDGTLKLWDLGTGSVLQTLEGHVGSVFAVAVSPEADRAVSASWDGTLKVWDLKAGAPVHTLSADVGWVLAVALTPNGQRAVSAYGTGDLKVWDLDTGAELHTFKGHTSAAYTVALTPDGRRAVSGGLDDTMILWDLEVDVDVRIPEGHSESVNAVAPLPDGRRVVTASTDCTLKLWDLETGTVLRTFKGQSAFWAASVTKDGQHAVSGEGDGAVRLWNLQSGAEVRRLKSYATTVNGVTLTPDGRHAICVTEARSMRLWDLETGATLHTFKGHSGPVNAMTVAPDGRRVLSASDDGTLRLWNLESGRLIRAFKGHSHSVNAVAVTADSQRAVSSSDDGTLKLWDLETGGVLCTLEEHCCADRALALIQGGQRAVSASFDGTLKLWDLETGTELCVFSATSGFTSCAVVLDGHRVVAGDLAGQFHVLRIHEPVPATHHTSGSPKTGSLIGLTE